MSETYTHGHAESVLDSHRRRTVENSAAYLMPYLSAGRRVLDAGCGAGTITADIAERVAPGQVTALDNKAEVIEAARRVAAERGIDTIEFVHDSIYALPFDDDSFDVVHAHQVLQHLARPLDALAELKRVCRPDGVIGVRDADYAAMRWYPDDPGLDAWRSLYRRLAQENGHEPDAGRVIMAWANEVGFRSVEPSIGVWCFATPDDRRWWGTTWADRIVNTAIAEQALDRGHATKAELEVMAAAWLRWVDDPNGWFGVMHGQLVLRP